MKQINSNKGKLLNAESTFSTQR